MALEVESLDSQPTKSPLTVKIPLNREISLSTSSSLESSSILPTTTSSSSSLPTLNVKFAPLPELLPRKRRSTVPLGMAARGQLIHRRTGYRGPRGWVDEGPEEYRMQREELAARDARCSAYAAYAAAREEEDEDEPESGYGWHHQLRKKNSEQVDVDDPLLALGRIVKVAGKTLWKRVSNRDVAAAAAAAAATSMPKQKVDSKRQEDSKTGSPISTKPFPLPTLRPILGSIASNLTSNVDDHHAKGAVWEEEIGNSFPRDVSQTETIIEGRAVYSRSTSKVEAMSNSLPPLPSVSNSKKMLTKLPSRKKVPPFKLKQGS